MVMLIFFIGPLTTISGEYFICGRDVEAGFWRRLSRIALGISGKPIMTIVIQQRSRSATSSDGSGTQSLLDNAPNYIVGCVIQKRIMVFDWFRVCMYPNIEFVVPEPSLLQLLVLLLAKREIASSQSLSVLPKSSMPFFWYDGPWSPLPIICFISMTKVSELLIPFEFSVFIMCYFSYWVNCFSTFPFKKPIFPKIWLFCIQIYVLSGAIWRHKDLVSNLLFTLGTTKTFLS